MTTGVLADDAIRPTTAGFNDPAYNRVVITIPAGGRLASTPFAGSSTPRLPEPVVHLSLTGSLAIGFALTDWYFRIHITPAVLALGNVVSNEQFTVHVWNAWLATSQTLNSLVGSAVDGITLSGEPNPPLTFKPNQDIAWTVNVSTDGPPTISGTFTWTFADAETAVLAITGQRITAWALTPNWEQPVREKLEWKTDVLQALSGAEQRRALRIAPRRTFSFDVQMERDDKRFVESSLFAWSAMVWALPIWPDGQRTTAALAAGATTVPCDTVNRDFVAGGLAMFISDARNYEVLQVTAVSSTALTLKTGTVNNWGAQSRLYPVRAARLSSYPRLTREHGQLALAQPSFLIVDACDWAAASGLPTYRGYPVLENSPAVGSGEATFEREAFTIDTETGVMDVQDIANVGFPSWSHEWFLQGRTARSNFRALLYLLKGRQGEIWVPTYEGDLALNQQVTSTATNIHVNFCGYTLYLAGQQNRTDIRIELWNGTVFYRRVTGSVVESATSELLSLDSALGTLVNVADVRRISYMPICRLNADAIEIEHLTAVDGLASAVTPWRAVNHAV